MVTALQNIHALLLDQVCPLDSLAPPKRICLRAIVYMLPPTLI